VIEGPGVSFEELLRYDEEQCRQWRDLFEKRPFLLKLEASPKDTVADVIFHTFTSQFRCAQRLVGETMTKDSEFSRRTVGDLFDIGDASRILIRDYLAHATQDSVSQRQKFPSHTLGEFEATPKKLLTHALVHSERHWGQVARILRENGHRADFSHDLLFSKAFE
jgi:uncharacterized damage-inducible protein DinB